jgi:uncharacterized protein (TIGR03118 family)
MMFNEWRQWLNRLFKKVKRVPHRRQPLRLRVERLEDRWVPSITPTGQATFFIEGAANPVVVATFTDTNPSPVANYNTSIDWGDGTVTAGTVSQAGSTFLVTGSHGYAEETAAGSSHTVRVTIQETTTGDTDSATATSTATVADASLAAIATTFSPTEASAFTGTVATFTDSGGAEPAANYTASIDWGDGTVTAGNVTNTGSNPVTVSGTHTYAEDGPYSVHVTLNDDGGQSAIATSTANVQEGMFVFNGVTSVTATEGQTFTGTVATINDPGSPDAASAFAATIDWGDGVTTTGTVTGVTGSGTFTITGSHVYADELSGNINVTVREGTFFTIGPLADPVTVLEGDVLTNSIQPPQNPTEGQAFTGRVANFANTNAANNTPADFTATIDWGDGTVTAGTVSNPGANIYGVDGTHTYADEGPFTVIVALRDDAPGTASATATNTVSVSEGDALTGTGLTFTATESPNSFTGNVATFTDTRTNAPATDFMATIDWGDGTVTAGTVSGATGGPFTVSGTHTYTEDGTFHPIVTLADDAPGSATAAATATANVGEANLGIVGVSISTTEGQNFSGTVAFASDPGSTDAGSAFSATINWGDGTTTAGTVSGSAGSYTISGSHSYADEGTFTATVTFQETNSPTLTVTTTDTVTVAEGDVVTVNPVQPTPPSLTEGQSFTGRVANFVNFNAPNTTAADFTATIDWGDGTVTPGTPSNPGANIYAVDGMHTYADEGPFTITVALRDDAPGTASATATRTFTVAEADALTGTGRTFTATESPSSFTGTVATFTDTSTSAPAADFSASINWGDGTVSAGTVTGSTGGPFTVSGTHTYAEDGSFTVTTTLTDDAPGTATATATGTATVNESSLGITAVPVSATEGHTFSGTVAFASDPGSPDAASAFSATINWGDNTTTAGTVTGSAGSYTISGSHSYADEGTFTATVTFQETNSPTFTVNTTDTVTVLEGDVLSGMTGIGQVTEGQTSTIFFTFNDSNTTNTASDFTATINFGDGTVIAGTVAGVGGTLVASGSHTYADEGIFTATATLTDDAPGTATATASSPITVSEADTLGPAAVQPSTTVTEGASTGGGAVAIFTHGGYPTNPVSDFTATINWGDGTTTASTVSTAGNGNFTVNGSHTYADEGTFTATVVIADDTPSTARATATSTFTVLEGDTLSATATPVSATEGAPFSTPVATFTSTYAGNVASDFSATILWGDGTSSTGTVSGAAGSFTVTGSHIYFDEGTFTPTVLISDDAPGTAHVTAVGSAAVAEGDTLIATPVTITPTEGTAFSGSVASFSDTGFPSNAATDFTATINWGDGTTTVGTVVGAGGGNFTVNGSHTYTDEGAFSVTVVLSDDFPGTTSATAHSTANVREGDSGSTVSQTITPTEGTAFSGAVAGFIDSGNPTQVASDFTATINWGDGTTTAGTVTGPTGGPFTISGSHTYSDEGTFTVVATFTDDAPSTLTATITSSAVVSEADTLTPTGTDISAVENSTFSGQVATFDDTNTANTTSDFTATINWGDGTTTTGTVSGGSGTFNVSGSHKYADEGSFTVSVTLTDDAPGTANATATATATVFDAPLSVTGQSLSTTESGTVTGSVATFTDSNTTATTADFTATIAWGDGTTSAGTVTGPTGGPFTVSGTHVYGEEGTFFPAVTVSDAGSVATSGFGNQTNLVADIPGLAPTTDADLVNPWGIAFRGAGPFWVNDNGTGLATLYNGNTGAKQGLVVTIPLPPGSTADHSAPTGIAAYNGTGFVLPTGGASMFLFATEDGTISAWNGAQGTLAVLKVDNSGFNAVYKGLAIASSGGSDFLYVTNFRSGRVERYDSNFNFAGSFSDPSVPAGYAPFGIANIGGNLYVTYAVQDLAQHDDVAGVGNGLVYEYDPTGNLIRVFATHGTLNSPWGLAVAPASFGTFGGDLLVGNFGDGKINAYNLTTTAFVGQLPIDTTGTPLAINGLWALAFGNSGSAGSASNLFFSAGFNHENDGLFGFLTAAPTPQPTATVSEVALSAVAGASVSATEGAATTVTVATFTDPAGAEPNASDPSGTHYAATINWGDGSSSAGSIVNTGGNNFAVEGSHTYGEEGSFTVTTTITHETAPTVTATSTASVTDARLATVTGQNLTATEGASVSATVASFSDPGGAEPNSADPATSGHYSATINWGDGTSSTGTVVNTGGNNFAVEGSHTYGEEGSFTVTTTITHETAPTVTATSTASVAEVPISATGVSVTGTDDTPLTGAVVATFTDPAGAEPNASDPSGTHYSATINWGDGTVTAGSISQSGGTFTVSGDHTYTEDGTFTVTTTITHESTTATVTSTATVAEASLATTAVPVSGFEFTPLTDVGVASFTHGSGTEPASDFSATINWGDGTSSTGTVVPSGTVYSVVGSHTYSDESTSGNFGSSQAYPVTVTIQDDTSTSTVSTSASILEELLPNGQRGTVSQRFISEMYRDLLHRAVDQGGLDTWTAQLDALVAQGVSMAQAEATIVFAIETESHHEYFQALVHSFYEQYLHRSEGPADMVSFNNDVNFLAANVPLWPHQVTFADTQVRLMFLTSPEYAQLHGGSDNAAYVEALYQDNLGRTAAGDAGAANLINELNQGTLTRGQAAAGVLASIEYLADEVTGYYEAYLGRPPSTQSDLTHVQALALEMQAGQPEEFVIAGILGDSGQEYLGKVQP